MIKGFDHANEKLSQLIDFSERSEQVLLELVTFKRIKTSHMAHFLGELTITEHKQMEQEFKYRKGLLKELQEVERTIQAKMENIEYFDQKDELSEEHDRAMKQIEKLKPIVAELEESLYGPKSERRKKSSGNRRRGKEEWKRQKANEKYG